MDNRGPEAPGAGAVGGGNGPGARAAEGGGLIRRLDPLLVDQIAAGEVVERPASVVKELLENALDAGARRIRVELERGGIELVRVVDDGGGIVPSDLPLALASHATSKIARPEDLERIGTMGFRGEALASIAAVARVALRSRRPGDEAASEVEVGGGRVSPVRPAAGPPGTSVSVRNLFFNTPARRKFLRTPATEQARCSEVVRTVAVAHPGLGFTLVCDGRVVLDLAPTDSPRERALAVLGRELEPELLEVHADEFGPSIGAPTVKDRPGGGGQGTGPVENRPHQGPGPVGNRPYQEGGRRAAGVRGAAGISLWGLVGTPALARATNKAQFVFLNGRPIRDKTIQHAVKEAYRGLIEPSRHPTAVLMIEIDPAMVDVNVHPAKTEVRFRDSSLAHSTVLRAVREALRAADLTPIYAARVRAEEQTAILPGGGGGGGARSGRGGWAFVEYFKRPAAIEGKLSFAAIRDAMREDIGGGRAGPVGSRPHQEGAHEEGAHQGGARQDGWDEPLAGRVRQGGAVEDRRDWRVGDPPHRDGSHPELLNRPRPAPRILQVHNSYLVTQDENGVVIIDQHALHERAMFELLMARIGQGDLESQRLLAPAVFDASAGQLERLEELAPLLKRIGVEAEQMGPGSVAVHAFPSFLFDKGVEPGRFVAELLERAEEGLGGEEAALHEVVDMMACKAAVKAGDRMSEAELSALVELREAVERSASCPHGRPTSVRLTIRELEKLFHRS